MISITESENEATRDIDKASTLDALSLINNEDKHVALAVEKVLPQVASVVDSVVARLENGGRLFYVGTGTSGRLGVLDASELPPTFGVESGLVQGVIAGGIDALYKATEASEDDSQAGERDLKARNLNSKDALIGIAASGRTPYTIGALKYARSLGCFTACITSNPDSPITNAADIAVVALVGPEAIAGSTRMKAGTAQKLILNMISTVTMIRMGYVVGNRMTNMRTANNKLRERSLRIIAAEAGKNEVEAQELLAAAEDDLRVALVMAKANVGPDDAKRFLAESNFIVPKAVEMAKS
ncbi:MAG TPA: N-acetylmuramic acid 6-phosphate etherase [Pyrinomonadaceae bacterium]|nr:N-acetylmuramic acid 6-phosphate etherase [Pyrinomonadaceae bacterium]